MEKSGVFSQVSRGQIVSVQTDSWLLFQAILAEMGQPASRAAQGTLTPYFPLVGSGF